MTLIHPLSLADVAARRRAARTKPAVELWDEGNADEPVLELRDESEVTH